MMELIARLRELAGGKPVGFKLCIGHRWEFLAITKAMLETGITPDFIVVDGAEGGTGAAPVELSDHVGTPLREGLVFAVNCPDRAPACATRSARGVGQDLRRSHAGGEPGAGGRLVQRRPRLHVLGRLRADQEVPHRPLPHRRRDAEQAAAERARGRRQGAARLPIPPQYGERPDAVCRRRRPASPFGAGAAPPADPDRREHRPLCRHALRVPRVPAR